MSLYTIAKLVFFVAIGLMLLGVFVKLCAVIAGIAALICAVLLVVGDNTRPLR